MMLAAKKQNIGTGSAELGAPPSATLLIVDDQPLYAEYIASIAQDRGWNAISTSSNGEFKAQFSLAEPRAVALDLDIPGHDGVELLRFMSDRGYAGSVMIISGCDESVVETSARLGREMGLNVIGYAQKPVTQELFAELLQRTIAPSEN
jgi:DNA-binding response OmpR family regulator